MANLQQEAQSNVATMDAKTKTVDMKFEIVVIPVSDVDRAKSSTKTSVGGWMPTMPRTISVSFSSRRLGSGCSVIFGTNVTAAAPGSAQGLYLIVSDIAAARNELLDRGVAISEVSMVQTRLRWAG